MPRRNSNAGRINRQNGHLNNAKSRGIGQDVQTWLKDQPAIKHNFVTLSLPSDTPEPKQPPRRRTRKAA